MLKCPLSLCHHPPPRQWEAYTDACSAVSPSAEQGAFCLSLLWGQCPQRAEQGKCPGSTDAIFPCLSLEQPQRRGELVPVIAFSTAKSEKEPRWAGTAFELSRCNLFLLLLSSGFCCCCFIFISVNEPSSSSHQSPALVHPNAALPHIRLPLASGRIEAL